MPTVEYGGSRLVTCEECASVRGKEVRNLGPDSEGGIPSAGAGFGAVGLAVYGRQAGGRGDGSAPGDVMSCGTRVRVPGPAGADAQGWSGCAREAIPESLARH